MRNHTLYEIVLCIVIIISATICILLGAIPSDVYSNIITGIIGYIIGRLSSRETREGLQDYVTDLMDFEKNPPILVAFSGKAGSGKSTIAKALVERHGFMRLNFAAELKRLCWNYFPRIMTTPKETYRGLLQEVGQLFRKWNPLIWVGFVIREVHRLEKENPGMRIVVDDLRYENELHALEHLGFLIVRVERDPKLRAAWGYNVEDSHPSEIALDEKEFPLYLQNNGPYPFDEAVQELTDYLGL